MEVKFNLSEHDPEELRMFRDMLDSLADSREKMMAKKMADQEAMIKKLRNEAPGGQIAGMGILSGGLNFARNGAYDPQPYRSSVAAETEEASPPPSPKKPKKTYTKWTPDMDANVCKWTEEGWGAAVIADRLGTTNKAVLSRRVALGVRLPERYLSPSIKAALAAKRGSHADA